MSKKGFTLVELLATIAIMGIIGMIAVFAYTSVAESNRTRVFKLYEKTMHSEAMSQLTFHPELIPSNGGKVTLSLTEEPVLLIDPIDNPRNKNDLCPTSYVEVTRNDHTNGGSVVSSFTYKVCLICLNSNYNVDGTDCVTYEN